MVRSKLLPLALAALVAAPSCGSCDRDRERDAAVALERDLMSERERATLGAIEALGDGPALVVVVWPDRWSRLFGALAQLAGGLEGQLDPDVRAALSASEPSKLVALALRAAGSREAAVTLDGLDPARPIVLGLADPPTAGPRGGVAVGLHERGDALPGLRHVALLPAADVDATTRRRPASRRRGVWATSRRASGSRRRRTPCAWPL